MYVFIMQDYYSITSESLLDNVLYLKPLLYDHVFISIFNEKLSLINLNTHSSVLASLQSVPFKNTWIKIF